MTISIDLVCETGILGWAIGEGGSEEPVVLQLEVDGHAIAEVKANRFREDLTSVRPDGCLAFEIPIVPEILPSIPRDARGRIVGSNGEVAEIRLPGTGSAQFNPLNCKGERLTLNKDGYLTVRFRDMTETSRLQLLGYTNLLIRDLDAQGYPSFLAYGTLLGCIRGGDFIPHDDDVDLGVYFGEMTDASEIDARSAALTLKMEALGYHVHRFSIGQIQISRGLQHVDLFAAWSIGGRFFLNFAVNGEVPTSTIFPLATATLRRIEFPVPADSPAFCAAIYGPDWRTPKPGFRWQREGMNPVVDKDLNAELVYWDRVYSTQPPVSTLPSQFAVFVAGELTQSFGTVDVLLDVGCGNARDTGFLAGFAHHTIGVDGAHIILDRNRTRFPEIVFQNCNFNDSVDCEKTAETLAASLATRPHATGCLYTRFFLHAIDAAAERRFLSWASALARGFDRLLLCAEYRTLADEGRTKVTADHYRRYIDHDAFAAAATSAGFSVLYSVEGLGMAKYKDDDAVVGRLVAIAPRA